MDHTRFYEENGILIQEVDSRHLEKGLLKTAELIAQRKSVVVLLTHYDDLLRTDHSLDYELLSQLLGVRVGLIENKEAVLAQPDPSRPQQIDSYAGFVHGALAETLHHAPHDTGHELWEKVDKVLTNRWVGFPILLVVLYLVFECTFTIGAYPQEWIAGGVESLCDYLTRTLPAGWLSSLLIDGLVKGIGAVLSFVPNILILFILLALMEDTGYMARAAFLMDKVMHAVGLHGRSFIPMLVGFGCNVPAIMAARNIENPKDRTLTMLMIPFMSCSARIPVYMLFVAAFFPGHKALMMMSMYAIGIVLSILFAMVMKRTKYFRQPKSDYVSELPQYRQPSLKEISLHVWERLWDYLQKIGTVILWASVIFDWKMSVCLLTGLPAKEAIISTMGILYGGDAALSAFTPLTAFGFMLFVLLYFPCIATIATLRREAGNGWAIFTVVHSLLLAWVLSFVVYQIGILFV